MNPRAAPRVLTGMSMNLIIQYTIVAAIIAAACIWMLVRILGKKKNSGGCCGCSLSDSCSPDKKNRHRAAMKSTEKETAVSKGDDGCGCGCGK